MVLLCAACANEFKGVRVTENPHKTVCTQKANGFDLTSAVTDLT